MAARSRRGFGSLRKLPSGSYQATYTGLDGLRHRAPETFEAKEDAEGWLNARRREVRAGDWTPPSAPRRPVVFGEYAEGWLARRKLKARSRAEYRRYLDRMLLPAFGSIPLKAFSFELVDDWYAGLNTETETQNARVYGLLRTILKDAVDRGTIAVNYANIRGAGNARRKAEILVATPAELVGLTRAMPEKYRAMITLSAWCGLRFGEVTALERRDLDLAAGAVYVRRGVTRVPGKVVVGAPKSDAGLRRVSIPPDAIPALERHLAGVGVDPESLLFPAADGKSYLAPSTFYGYYYPARAAIGRSDLRFHDLRHTGAMLAAESAATLPDLMNRLGHSTHGAALRYQHAAEGRDQQLASRMSAFYTED